MSNSTVIKDREVTPNTPIDEPTLNQTLAGTFTEEELKKMAAYAANLKNPDEVEDDSFKIVDKTPAFITDFSSISESDIYDLQNIEVRPFMSADILKAELIDTNFTARWVNKNPQRLGSMIARGFRYVEEADLLNPLANEVAKDAEDHYAYDDVVLMKIPKAIYYPALKAAQAKALKATSQLRSGELGKNEAQRYMERETGSGYAQAASEGKINFYNPQVGI